MVKTVGIILAAGKGSRMGAGINKQFLELNGKPILFHTIKVFEENDSIDEIILVSAVNEVEYCTNEIVNKYGFKKVLKVVPGGKERQDSVLCGLYAAEECDIVLIHDGARPFVNNHIIEEGIKYAKLYGCSACGVTPIDTIKVKSEDGFSRETLKRDTLVSIQTPQCFKYEIIKECHEKIKQENIKVTDDTMVVERFGNSVYLYDGIYENIKITNKNDLVIGEEILKKLFTNQKDNV